MSIFNERFITNKQGKTVHQHKISYMGYETRSILGIKYRKKVWKTKWISHEAYLKRKRRPLVSRPWEARFFK